MSGHPINVLFVEDYALGAALVRDTLRRQAPDIRLDIVPTVADALARLKRFELGQADTPRYDVVLTDLNLPDGLGLEILSHVRGRQLMLAVVILTGSGDEASAIGALHAGANDYVAKRDDYLTALPRTLYAALAHFRSEAERTSTPLQVVYADADLGAFESVRADLTRRAPHLVIRPVHSAGALLRHLTERVGWMPDVLLLDDQLPGLSTIELIRQVHARPGGGELPIVLAAARGNERIAQLAIRLGVADYLNKSDGYLQRLPFALESAHLKAVAVRERAALRRSEAQYRSLVNNLPDVVIRFDRAGRHLYVSPPIEAISGKPPSFYIGRTHAEVGTDRAMAQLFRDALDGVFGGAGEQRIEFEADVLAGRRFFEVALTAEHDTGGAISTVLAIARDITARRLAEIAVRDAAALARNTVDALSAQVAIIDENGEVLAVNRAWRLFAERNEGDVRRVSEGSNYLAVCDAAARDSADASRVSAGLRSVIRDEIVEFSHEYPCHSPSEQRWFNARATRFPGDGRARVVIAHENITPRKQAEAALRESEEQFRAFFENAIDAILVTVPDGRIIAANPSACRMFVRTEAELLGGGRAMVMDMSDPRLGAAIRERAATGKFRGELSFVRSDGSRFEGELTAAIYIDRSGLDKSCLVIRDITERREQEARVAHYRDELEAQVAARTAELAQANEALTAARDAADAANRAKTQFLSNMSHEIRTPMGAILGLARLMRSELADGPALDHLLRLQQSGDHLLRIVNDVLDLSKIEAGQLELEDADFSPRDILSHAIDMLAQRATEKGLAVDLTLDEALPARLRGDALRLEQIVLNFLANAIKFTPRGSVHLRAAAVGGRLRIEMQDSGVGMTPAQLERLFRPFSQASTSTAREFGGTGLGLTIARRLAAMMGGDVGVSSQSGHGSTFWLELPLRAATGPAPEPRDAQRSAGTAVVWRPPPPGTRILLAEDDPVNQLVTSHMLEELGFEVDLADNGEEAVAKARTGGHALVLMDLNMPLMDGAEATRLIRQIPELRSLVILALSASVFEDDRLRCEQAGMNGHLSKPVDPVQMQAALTRWLNA